MRHSICKRNVRTTISLGVVLAVAASVGIAAESMEDLDQRLTNEIKKQNQAAAVLFVQANQARARKEHELAAELYGRVYTMAPQFVHAIRRQCSEVAEVRGRAAALPLCREAVAKETSAQNLAVLSLVIGSVKKDEKLSQAEKVEALELAAKAVELQPNDSFFHIALCRAAMTAESIVALRRCVEALSRLLPDAVDTHVAKMVLALSDGRPEEAEKSLERLRALGISESDYQSGLALIRNARPLGSRILLITVFGGGLWLAGFVTLLFSGWVLSHIVLRTAARVPAGRAGESRGIDAALRRVYRVVLWLCCVFYYISLPLVFLVILATGGGLLYAFIAAGHIPIKIAFIIVVVTFVTLWAIIKSVFVKSHDVEPGIRLKVEEHPKLATLLTDVANAVGTRPVDVVYMTPGTDIAVMERGATLRQFAGRKERCLILGAGVLEGMRLGQFRAILAHEYGHLSNRDTAGGEFALAVRRSLLTMAHNLASGGAAAWYNPAWLFLNGFYRIFLRISHGASRLQEVLADRWAATIFGAQAFEQGLRHVIARSVRFEAYSGAALDEVIERKAALANLYSYRPATLPPEEEIETKIQAALTCPASPYDSHPSPMERFKLVHALPTLGTKTSADDESDAWSLFSDRAQIEMEMTDVVRENVQAHSGVEIPNVEPESTDCA